MPTSNKGGNSGDGTASVDYTTQFARRDGSWAVPDSSGVSAGDASIVISSGSVTTGTLDAIASAHAPAGNWSNNSHKITGLADGSASTDAAAYGQVLPIGGGTLTGWVAPAVVALSFSTTPAVNAAAGNIFTITLTASTATMQNPTNPVDGQVIRLRVTQGGSGSYTLAFDTAYDFGAAGAPTLSTSVGKVDELGFAYNAALSKWCYMGSALGF